MFRKTLASSPLSLFSSTSSNPFSLFSVQIDSTLPEDSGCVLVQDDTDEEKELEANEAALIFRDPSNFKLRSSNLKDEDESVDVQEKDEQNTDRRPQSITQTVLHLQSPTIATTYIRSPPLLKSTTDHTNHFNELGLTNSCIHFQLKPLDSRPLVIEVGVKDFKGQIGRIRLSNFQARPTLYLFNRISKQSEGQEEEDQEFQVKESRSPLLHLPLALPQTPNRENNVLTEWCSFTLNLPYFMPHLHNPSLLSLDTAKAMSEARTDEDRSSLSPALIPFDRFESLTYVKVSDRLFRSALLPFDSTKQL